MNMKSYENVKRNILDSLKDMHRYSGDADNVASFVKEYYYEVFYTVNEVLKSIDDGVANYIIMRDGMAAATTGEILVVAEAIIRDNASNACVKAFELVFGKKLAYRSKRAYRLADEVVALIRSHR